MCGLCFYSSFISVIIKITFLFFSIYLKEMENLNNENWSYEYILFDQDSVGVEKSRNGLLLI